MLKSHVTCKWSGGPSQQVYLGPLFWTLMYLGRPGPFQEVYLGSFVTKVNILSNKCTWDVLCYNMTCPFLNINSNDGLHTIPNPCIYLSIYILIHTYIKSSSFFPSRDFGGALESPSRGSFILEAYTHTRACDLKYFYNCYTQIIFHQNEIFCPRATTNSIQNTTRVFLFGVY